MRLHWFSLRADCVSTAFSLRLLCVFVAAPLRPQWFARRPHCFSWRAHWFSLRPRWLSLRSHCFHCALIGFRCAPIAFSLVFAALSLVFFAPLSLFPGIPLRFARVAPGSAWVQYRPFGCDMGPQGPGCNFGPLPGCSPLTPGAGDRGCERKAPEQRCRRPARHRPTSSVSQVKPVT